MANKYMKRCLTSLLLLLLLSRFSRVQLCATPGMAAHQVPPSLGFSRQEHWSGLPLPSPMHGSEKWKGSRSVVSDSSRPHGLQPTRLLCQKCKSKLPWSYHLTLVRMAIIKKIYKNKCWRLHEGKETLLQCWWEGKLVQPLWRTV